MTDKTPVDKSYDEGYKSTRDGNFWDDMCSGAVGTSDTAKAYNDGARKGSIDRGKYGPRDKE